MKKDKRRIPKGYYCYSQNYKEFKDRKRCPYWSIRRGKPKQNNGYCAYLEKGDWDFNKEKRWRDVYTRKGKKDKLGPWQSAYEMGFYMSLIWDQVKECDVKREMSKKDEAACVQL